uniref:Protein kinase domain-containing protein n=1 Tax=Phytophthora fragariae TaxID=53985 RepID=A0A6A3ERI1_9STRA|nr:hypothetical protein PF009_g16001 [Phytophthora fragariae]
MEGSTTATHARFFTRHPNSPPKKTTGRYFKREDRRTVMSQSQPHPSPCHEPESTPSTPAKPIDLGSPTSATESSACMASPCFSFMFASKCERNGRASSAGSSDLDELGDAPVQQLPPDHKEIPHLDLNKPSTDVTDGMASPLDNTQPLAYQGALSPRQQSGKRYHGGYLQHRVPMAVGLLKSWKRKYFRLREHGLVCYKTQDSATPLFEVKFTAHSVLVLDKSQGDRTSSSSSFSTRPSTGRQAGACADSSEKHRRTSWPIPSSGALVLVLKHVEVTGHQTPAKAVEVPVFLKAEDEADRTAWTECMRYMIEAHKRALFQANLEKGQSDEDTDELMSPAQPLTSADTAMELSAQRGSETSSKEVIKMPRRRRSSGSAVAPDLLPMLNNLVEVETFEAFSAKYLLMKEIGEGSFSIVHRAVNRMTGQVCAVKCCKISAALEEEERLLRTLSHPNVIADFGLAKELAQPTSMLKRSCGTLEYAAPELLCGRPYGLKSDVFSLGIVMYVLLFGAFPFSVEFAAALQCMDHFPKGVDVRDMSCLSRSNVQWRTVSPLAQDALLKMLKADESERISAEDLLGHPWFDEIDDDMSGSANCNGSSPEEFELARIEDCEALGLAELLSRGFQVVKYCYKESTAPHSTSLTLNFMEECITWTARNNSILTRASSNTNESGSTENTKRGRVIPLREIKEIREGHTTEAFLSRKHLKSVPPPELCLSIVCHWRTLDLVVEAPSQREFMVRGLRRLLPSSPQ